MCSLYQFQSTRPRGARPDAARGMVHRRGFNPRARAGRDECETWIVHISSQVSIHAPARGATATSAIPGPADIKFQSTRPRGARPVALGMPLRQNVFQSTRPRGARQGRPAWAQRKIEFQSTRPRGARRQIVDDTLMAGKVFQSTRPRGARLNVVLSDHARD